MHFLQVQLAGGSDTVEFGPSNPETLHPDLDWLEEQCSSSNPPRLVYIVNPSNPSGLSNSHHQIRPPYLEP